MADAGFDKSLDAIADLSQRIYVTIRNFKATAGRPLDYPRFVIELRSLQKGIATTIDDLRNRAAALRSVTLRVSNQAQDHEKKLWAVLATINDALGRMVVEVEEVEAEAEWQRKARHRPGS
jgi:hypothetical protein